MGTPLTIGYFMTARGEGRLIDNIGLAGINDPFILDTAPVLPGQTLAFAFAPVPEPSLFALLLSGGLLLVGRRMRSSAPSPGRNSACTNTS